MLRRRRFFLGDTVTHEGQPLADLVWLRPDAREMAEDDWQRADAHVLGAFLNGDAIAEPDAQGEPVVDDSFLLLLNGFREPVVFRLPDPAYGERWMTRIDTSDPQGLSDETEHKAGSEVAVEAHGLLLLSRPLHDRERHRATAPPGRRRPMRLSVRHPRDVLGPAGPKAQVPGQFSRVPRIPGRVAHAPRRQEATGPGEHGGRGRGRRPHQENRVRTE
ncbi:hypothetical protein SALBM135S_03215 [Streptomyces alboniger]